MCVCMYMHVKTKRLAWCPSLGSVYFVFEAAAFPGLQVTDSARLANNPQASICLCLPSAQIKSLCHHICHPYPCLRFWGLNLGPYRASTLLTEPSSLTFSFYWIKLQPVTPALPLLFSLLCKENPLASGYTKVGLWGIASKQRWSAHTIFRAGRTYGQARWLDWMIQRKTHVPSMLHPVWLSAGMCSQLYKPKSLLVPI